MGYPRRARRRLQFGDDANGLLRFQSDESVPTPRSGHDLAAKPGDLGDMHLRINPPGERRGRPTRPKTVTSPDLRMTTDTGCGRGRFDLNQHVFTGTAQCPRNIRRNGRTVGT